METEEDERGAGGKIKKSIRNSNNPTPYARQNQQHVVAARGGLWNLISGGATRLFPSFFSRTPIFNPDQTDAGEAKQDVSDEGPENFQNITRSNEGGRAPFEAEVSTIDTYMDVNAGNTLHVSSDGTGISEIEMMLKGKTLSRHDLNRLAEILRSKVAVQSDVGEGGKRQLDVPKGEAVAASLSQENLKGPDNEKEALYLNRVVGESSSPFSKSTSRSLASASPIEIAKAYMGTRTSELGSQSVYGKEKKNTVPASDFLSKSPVPTLTQNSSVCWPGAMVEQSHSYLTPQTERVEVKQLQTPYSRPVHSRITSKLEGDGDRSRDTLSTNLKQMQTPVYAASQVSRMGIYSLNDGFGSVGTFRRTHRKFHGTMTPKGTSSSRSAISGVSRKESFDASKHLFPMENEILKPGASTSSNIKLQPVVVKEPDSVGVATVHFHSIDMARKILEHLDRTIPIPEKKSAELKLATSWRNLPPSESTNSIVKAPVGIPRVENSKTQLGQKFSNQEKENTCLLNSPGQTKSGEATNTVNTKSLGSSVLSNEIFPGGTSVQFNSKPSTELEKIPEFEVNRNEVSIRHDEGFQSEMNHPIPKQGAVSGQAFSMFPHTDASCKILNAPLKLSTHSFGNKPTLTSISINKPDPTSRISFDNGSGFTFPIPASLASLFEPPTPSIIPSFSAKGLPLPKENNTFPANSSSLEKGDPSYSFGSKTADRTLVFSFASSGLSTPTDFSVPKFAFGSGKARMNFRSKKAPENTRDLLLGNLFNSPVKKAKSEEEKKELDVKKATI